jgi:hypothetical protein
VANKHGDERTITVYAENHMIYKYGKNILSYFYGGGIAVSSVIREVNSKY